MRFANKTALMTFAVMLLALTNLSRAEDAASNYEQLKEYGDAVVGEWIQETRSDVNFEDLVNQGDTVTVRIVNKWVLNKNAISTHWTAQVNGVQVATGQSMTGWDRSAKRIISSGFNSLGGHGHGILEKRNGQWFDSGMGVGPLGYVGAGTSITTMVTEDSHETLQMGRLNPAGEPLPNRTVTVNRVK